MLLKWLPDRLCVLQEIFRCFYATVLEMGALFCFLYLAQTVWHRQAQRPHDCIHDLQQKMQCVFARASAAAVLTLHGSTRRVRDASSHVS